MVARQKKKEKTPSTFNAIPTKEEEGKSIYELVKKKSNSELPEEAAAAGKVATNKSKAIFCVASSSNISRSRNSTLVYT